MSPLCDALCHIFFIPYTSYLVLFFYGSCLFDLPVDMFSGFSYVGFVIDSVVVCFLDGFL